MTGEDIKKIISEIFGKINWKKKLTSRKWWMGLAGAVSGFVVAFAGTPELAQKIAGIILAAASIVAYIIGEGLADSGSEEFIIETKEDKKEEEDKAA